MRTSIAVIILPLLAALAGTARADTTATARDIPTLDTTVPDAPAFTILGITPSQITRPKTPAEAAAALGTAIGADGTLRAGAAIELAPGLLVHAVDLAQYQHFYYRFLHNAQLSLGTSSSSAAMSPASGGAAGSSTDMAVGFRLTIYDAADPLLDRDLMDAYKKVFADRPPPSFPTGGGSPTDLPDDVKSRLADAQTKATSNVWNATAVQVAAAYAWTSPDSSLKRLTHKGWAAWATGAERLGSWGQIVELARVIKNGSAAVDPGTTLVAGGRFIVGGPKWGASIEGAYNRLFAESPAVSDAWGQAALAFELNIASRSWLEISFGDTFDKQGQNDRFFSLANLKWTLDSKRVLLAAP
jgi:hypothetical protein